MSIKKSFNSFCQFEYQNDVIIDPNTFLISTAIYRLKTSYREIDQYVNGLDNMLTILTSSRVKTYKYRIVIRV